MIKLTNEQIHDINDIVEILQEYHSELTLKEMVDKTVEFVSS